VYPLQNATPTEPGDRVFAEPSDGELVHRDQAKLPPSDPADNVEARTVGVNKRAN
jgi:hypothetical protein